MIITNIGCSGAGKSTFSASLASGIQHGNSRSTILLINFDANVPMHAIWEPKREISKMYSIGTLFENDRIDEKTLTKSIVTMEHHPNIGTLAFCIGDTPLLYKDIEYKQVIDMLKAAEQLVDYVIVDCSCDLLADTTVAAIEMANCLNVFLTPDPMGVVYLKTARLMYDGKKKFMVDNTNYFLTPCRSFSATPNIKEALKIKAFELPYSNEIAVKNCEGDIFGAYQHAPRRYKNAVKKILASVGGKVEKNVVNEQAVKTDQSQKRKKGEMSNVRKSKRTVFRSE